MILGRVSGTVVSTRKDHRLDGVPTLVVEKLDVRTAAGSGTFIVALDSVGAGIGEVVVCVSGSSSRMTDATNGRPVDATITAIVDQVELDGGVVYDKTQAGA